MYGPGTPEGGSNHSARSCGRSLLRLLLGLQSLLLLLRQLGTLFRETHSSVRTGAGKTWKERGSPRRRTSSLDFLLFFFGVSSAAPSAAISDLRFYTDERGRIRLPRQDSCTEGSPRGREGGGVREQDGPFSSPFWHPPPVRPRPSRRPSSLPGPQPLRRRSRPPRACEPRERASSRRHSCARAGERHTKER